MKRRFVDADEDPTSSRASPVFNGRFLFHALAYHCHRDEPAERKREAAIRHGSERRIRELLKRSEPDAVVGDHAS